MTQLKKKELKRKDIRGNTPDPKAKSAAKKASGPKLVDPTVNPMKPDVLKARVPTGQAAEEYVSPSAPLDEEPT